MTTDITALVGAVRREVQQRDYQGRPATVVIASRTYSTTIDDLWDALTNPERIPRWFLPITGELRLGGRYQLEGNAGGTITVCEPPRRFHATWEFGGGTTWIEVSLTAEARGGTTLRLEHIAHVTDELWNQFGPGAVGVGWDLGLFGLGRYLESGSGFEKGNEMAWLASPEGHRYVGLTSDEWCRASVESGTEPAAARAAADRTTAAYTGQPSPSA